MQPPLITVIVTLFFTLNPVGNLPVFIALLKDFPPRRQVIIIAREMIFALILMLLFAFFGRTLLKAIGITEFIVSIGGGVILFLIAIRLVFPHAHADPGLKAAQREPMIVPLATPIVAGGATLATVMVYGLYVTNRFELVLGLVIAWAINVVILMLSPVAKRIFSETVLLAIERFMGLILILIACQMIVGGAVAFVQEQINKQSAAKAAPKEETSIVPQKPVAFLWQLAPPYFLFADAEPQEDSR